jgi:hypothetical protein
MAVRLGVLLIVLSCLCWLVIPLVPAFGLRGTRAAGAVGSLVVTAEIVFWLGVVLVGRDTWDIARRHGWSHVPGTLWRLLRDGRTIEPRSSKDAQ